ncbi:MAG: extensin family protein [Pseudolabrys sp.]
MNAVVRFSLVGAVALVMLAGCGRGFFQGQRAPWRHEAEVKCLRSGAVKIGPSDVQLKPIEGPGVCGMDFPLKVSMLGEQKTLSFADIRPPAGIPRDASMPRWPVRDQYFSARSVQSAPLARVAPHRQLRWVTGPRAVNAPTGEPAAGTPMSITPQNSQQGSHDAYSPPPRASLRAPSRPWGSPAAAARAAPQPNDIPPDAILPGGRRPAPRMQSAYNAPDYRQPATRRPPALGPARGPYTPVPEAKLKPAAKLACPIVSALDRWVSDGVQPAALHWFHSPVVEIHQIGAYSCRDMVGAGTRHTSEHAFGNALDISGFTLADGRTITVKKGWHGSPEEQGFLHDVQLYACETFTTVLAPGYNIFHYNHIHVDLMKRRPGYRPCRPTAIRGEIVAARVRAHYASRGRGPLYTGSIGSHRSVPDAVAGADGLADRDKGGEEAGPSRNRSSITDSIPWPSPPSSQHPFGAKGSASQIY